MMFIHTRICLILNVFNICTPFLLFSFKCEQTATNDGVENLKSEIDMERKKGMMNYKFDTITDEKGT